ncbi:hypothetical protein [Helicobacter sp. 23-1045]
MIRTLFILPLPPFDLPYLFAFAIFLFCLAVLKAKLYKNIYKNIAFCVESKIFRADSAIYAVIARQFERSENNEAIHESNFGLPRFCVKRRISQ